MSLLTEGYATLDRALEGYMRAGSTGNPTVKPSRPQALSTGEETLALHLRAVGIPFERQMRFHPTRQWRLDFAISNESGAQNLAVEIQGLLKGKPGTHQRVDGLTREYEKLNAAVLLGWRVLLFTPAQVRSGYALDTIRKALA